MESESDSGSDFATEAEAEAEGVEMAREEGGVDSSFTRVCDACSALMCPFVAGGSGSVVGMGASAAAAALLAWSKRSRINFWTASYAYISLSAEVGREYSAPSSRRYHVVGLAGGSS